MNGTRDANETAPADEGGLALKAAALLEQTGRQAQRQFEVKKPLLSLIGAAVILVIYGVVWFSVRGQHPCGGPSLAAIAVVYALVIVMSIAGGTVLRRATTGLGGRALRGERAYGAADRPRRVRGGHCGRTGRLAESRRRTRLCRRRRRERIRGTGLGVGVRRRGLLHRAPRSCRRSGLAASSRMMVRA